MGCVTIFTAIIGYIAVIYFSLKLFFKIESRDFPDTNEKKNFSVSLCKAFFWPIFMPIELITEIYKFIMKKHSDKIINHFKKGL